MATRIIKQKVCDMCGAEQDVRAYRVGVVGDGKGTAPDLCAEHAKPLEEVMAAVPSKRPASGLRKPPKVKSEAEVAKLRKPTRRRA